MENNSKITDIKNLKYILKREGYYWSDIFDHTNSKEIFLSIHKIESNSGAPLHVHENEEIIYVIKGSIEAKVDDKLMNINEGQIVLIPQKTEHSLKNLKKEEAKIAIIFATNNPFSKTKYLK
jgi:quercetin dioxygenase-like cupin family protein